MQFVAAVRSSCRCRSRTTFPLCAYMKGMTSKDSPLIAWFLLSAGVVLALTGTAKIVSSFGAAGLLAKDDPILRISFEKLMILAGVLEIFVASWCFFGRSRALAATFVALISTNILIYRFGLWWIGWRRPCHCLGNLTDALRISPHIADIALKVTLAYLIVGSYSSLACFFRQKSASASSMKSSDTPLSSA